MFGGDDAYFVGVHLFDTFALFTLQHYAKGFEKKLLMFFCGMAFYNLVKPLFADPTVDSFADYFYFITGILFISIQYVFQRPFK